ncbi:MAG: ATP-binding cassette domain-containing protein [Candidatus Stahlbacteria bacterium]|nr:MAG: ATP-binding cassette domain-containing protein [Candidatus Stahlbacteria bacterium]
MPNYSASMLVVKDIYKTFGNVEALKGLSFEVKKGSIYGLLGPNASGKTTTIRIILSIIYPDKGNIEMDFEKIGYMPEERGLYPKMQIDELIYFFGSLRGMKKEIVESQMNFWLERLELLDRKKDKIETLSKGLKQRLHLLISIFHDPQFLILDEPFTGLDPIAVKELRELFSELKDSGKTVLLSTHWMEQAEQLCDYVCLIKEGEKIYSGSLEELKEKHMRNDIYIETKGLVDFKQIPKITDIQSKGKGFIIRTEMTPGDFIKSLTKTTEVVEFRLVYPSLEEIFIKEVEGE